MRDHAGGSQTPAIARLVVLSMQGDPAATMHQNCSPIIEKEVLDGLAAGLMYKEIAAKGDVNINTVRSHVRSIYEKLQVHSRRRLCARRSQGGWGSSSFSALIDRRCIL
ncbi:MAG: LuxR C-terminal-related transcriptional regulator [Flavobacteriales bacterium]